MDAFQPDYWRDQSFFDSIVPAAQSLDWQVWPVSSDYYAELSRLTRPRCCVPPSPQSQLPYELHVGELAQIPTRYANWHDYFNALIWAMFPRCKQLLNDLHRQHWSRVRSPVRDRLTLFDESGALVLCDDESVIDALRGHRWREIFVDNRDDFTAHARVLLFGHGQLEKCLQPYVGMTAQAHYLSVSAELLRMTGAELIQKADECLVSQWSQMFSGLTDNRGTRNDMLSPLPILGLPGWWRDNEQSAFYDKVQYFRPKRVIK